MKKSIKIILCFIVLAVVSATFFACKDKGSEKKELENNEKNEMFCLHEFDGYKVVTEPTKTTKGKATSTCTLCKEIFNFTLLELGEVGYTLEEVDVDCEKGGKIKYTSQYGVFYEKTDPPGHNYTKISGGTEVGCLTDGEEKYVCARCGKEYTKEVPALGHKYEVTDEFEGNCETNGYVEKTCSACGDVVIEYGEENHKFGEGVYNKGNCTQYGYTRYECTECGEISDILDTRYGHKFSSDGICELCETECEHVFEGLICNYCSFDIDKRVTESGYYLVDDNRNKKADVGEFMYFGFYPRTHVRDFSLINALKGIEPDEDGYYRYENKKYARRTLNQKNSALATFEDGSIVANINIKKEDYFYRVEPIKWIIKDVETDGTLLLETANVIDVIKFAEKVVYDEDDMEYYFPSEGGSEYYADVWEYSDLRKTLNGNFVDSAFGENAEYICDTINKNDDESGYYADMINSDNEDTTDKVFVASYCELFGPDEAMDNVSAERQKIATDFAIGGGAELSKSYETGITEYYTRSVGSKTSNVCTIKIDGTLNNSAYVGNLCGVAPRVRVNFDKK